MVLHRSVWIVFLHNWWGFGILSPISGRFLQPRGGKSLESVFYPARIITTTHLNVGRWWRWKWLRHNCWQSRHWGDDLGAGLDKGNATRFLAAVLPPPSYQLPIFCPSRRRWVGDLVLTTPFPRPTRDMGGKFPPGGNSPPRWKFIMRVGGISPPLADFLIKVGEIPPPTHHFCFSILEEWGNLPLKYNEGVGTSLI